MAKLERVVYRGSLYDRTRLKAQRESSSLTGVDEFLKSMEEHTWDTNPLKGRSPDSVLKFSTQVWKRRLSQIPDLSLYPELESHLKDPEVIVQAYMDELKIGYEEAVFIKNNAFLCTCVNQETIGSFEEKKCLAIGFSHTDEGPLASQNCDTEKGGWMTSVDYIIPEEGYKYIEAVAQCNEKGFTRVGASTGVPDDEIPLEIFPIDLCGLIMLHCANVAEAVEMSVRYKGFGPVNGASMFMDGRGNLKVVEHSRRDCEVIAPEKDYLINVAGYWVGRRLSKYLAEKRQSYLSRTGKGEDSVDVDYFRGCPKRHENCIRLLEANKKRDRETLWKVLHSHAHYPESICVHDDGTYPEYTKGVVTIASAICNPSLQNIEVKIWNKEKDIPPCQDEGTFYAWDDFV